METWIICLALFFFTVISVSNVFFAHWGARIWAIYVKDHRWSFTHAGPIPDGRSFWTAIKYYLFEAHDE